MTLTSESLGEVEFSISRHMKGGPFRDTRYDRDGEHLTQGIIARKCRYGNMQAPDFYTGILHYDEAPVLGNLERIFDLAQAKANELGEPVYAAQISGGGGRSAMVRPELRRMI